MDLLFVFHLFALSQLVKPVTWLQRISCIQKGLQSLHHSSLLIHVTSQLALLLFLSGLSYGLDKSKRRTIPVMTYFLTELLHFFRHITVQGNCREYFV